MDVKIFIKNQIEKKVSRRALAKRGNVSLGTIQNILLGDTEIKNSTLEKMSRGFGLPFHSTGDRTDIALRDVAAARVGITEQPSMYNKVDKYKVIAEVGEILDSGHTDVIDALVKNVKEFKRAVETSKRLYVCEDELKEVREEIADLRKQVDRLSSSDTGADRQAATSEKAVT